MPIYNRRRLAGGSRTFSDTFDRGDGDAGNGWSAGTISSGRLVISPTLGAERVANGNFSSWSAGVPVSWLVAGNSGAQQVTQVGNGESSGGAGTGAANLYRDSATLLQLFQLSVFSTPNDWYLASFDIDTLVSGGITFSDTLTFTKTYTTPGTKLLTVRTPSTSGAHFRIQANANPTDITVDNASAKIMTLATLFATRQQKAGNASAQAKMIRVANTQAGMVHYADASNFVFAYDDGAGTCKLEKCIAGVYTTVGSAGITYVADAVIKLVRSGSTYAVEYNGSTLIAAIAVTDAVMAGVERWGGFSTYSGNSLDDYQWSAA